jgi:Pyruvate/2-oxoacid:ferredoxin oxidoreductase gamma subunit
MRTGMWAAQKDDFPVTVKSGHSVSEVILAPDEIDYTGVERPDALVIISDDGLDKAPPYLEAMDADGVVLIAAGLPVPETDARVVVLDPSAAEVRIASASLALALVSAAVATLDIVPLAVFEEVAGHGAFGPKNLEIVAAGVALAG